MKFTWVTGSVVWIYNVLTKEMIGMQPDYDALVIALRLPSAWNEVTAMRFYQGKRFDIRMERLIAVAAVKVTLNETVLEGNRISLN